jgi:outer membrane lipoprotein carrier protein
MPKRRSSHGWARRTWRPLLVLLALATPTLFAAQTQQTTNARQSPEALAEALQQRYRGNKDFSPERSQSYRGGVLRTQAVEQGTVSVKKPGMMRWEYLKPEKKEFVSDGR